MDGSQSRAHVGRILADCDLVHGFSLYAASILRLVAPLRIPQILTVNTDFHPSSRDFVRLVTQAPFYLQQLRYSAAPWIPPFLLRQTLLRFDRIISWTGFLHDKLRSLGIPARKLARIPVGLDLASVDLKDRRDPGGSPLYLYSGALSSLRGIAILIRAFRVVKNTEPEARLVIADRGPHSAKDLPIHTREIRRLSRQIDELGLSDSVLRSEYGGDLSAWTNTCDVVVHPFVTTLGYSHPPLTLLEAMAHGKPVISSCIGSVPEHLRDGISGIVVEPGNVEALAEAMLGVTPESGRRMGRQARSQIETEHDWGEITERTEAVYVSTLSD